MELKKFLELNKNKNLRFKTWIDFLKYAGNRTEYIPFYEAMIRGYMTALADFKVIGIKQKIDILADIDNILQKGSNNHENE